MNEMNILTLNGEQYEVADQKARKHNENTAPAIPVTMTGTAVSTDMVSPVEHDVKCKVSGVDDLTAVTVSRYGKNIFNPQSKADALTISEITPEKNIEVLQNAGIQGNGFCKIKTYIPKGKWKVLWRCLTIAETPNPVTIIESSSGERIARLEMISKTNEVKGLMDIKESQLVNIKLYPKTPLNKKTTYQFMFYHLEDDNYEAPIEPENYHPSSDGTVTGMKSISPSMTILTDNPGANLEVTYNADTKKYIDSKSGGKQSGITLTANIDTGSEVTATDGTDTLTETSTDGKAKFLLPHGGAWDVSAKKDGAESNRKTVDVADNYAVSLSYVTIDKVLNNNSWADIHATSASGEAQNYWSVGDTKQIIINGQVGKTTFNNLAIDVFIIGFNHNAELEGNNLTHFQIGKIGGKDVALCDSEYGDYDTTGGYFNWNTSDTNVGGWNECYKRKTLYGNISVPTSPLGKSLIGAFPEELRSIIQPVTKYTDNIGNRSNALENVTPTTDYLWDLAEYEIFGSVESGNQYEQNKQQQYQYYKSGNSKIAYFHYSTDTPACWGIRSANRRGNNHFLMVHANGSIFTSSAIYCYGLRPGFAV